MTTFAPLFDLSSPPPPLPIDGQWRGPDLWGAIKVRLGLRRHDYRVSPGLYALGAPPPDAPVLVTANYKLTFDLLRRAVDGESLWILVLDTQGVNVWCAAGKGTFGTDELIARIQSTGLSSHVNHRTLILPQLGAPGIAAHEIKRYTGYEIAYGPVDAADLRRYLAQGQRADTGMRRVRFDWKDRLLLTPVELKPLILFLSLLAFLHLVGLGAYSAIDGVYGLFVWLLGGFIFPLLLPVLPFRAFSLKGLFLGLPFGLVFALIVWQSGHPYRALSFLLVLPTAVSYMGLNFTGATPFTSQSGVQLEMKRALPLYLLGAAVGLGLFVLDLVLVTP